jgi:stringent starvation protein B
VLGIYARETGQGMIFSEADTPPQPPTPPSEPAPVPTEAKRTKPTLKVIK